MSGRIDASSRGSSLVSLHLRGATATRLLFLGGRAAVISLTTSRALTTSPPLIAPLLEAPLLARVFIVGASAANAHLSRWAAARGLSAAAGVLHRPLPSRLLHRGALHAAAPPRVLHMHTFAIAFAWAVASSSHSDWDASGRTFALPWRTSSGLQLLHRGRSLPARYPVALT